MYDSFENRERASAAAAGIITQALKRRLTGDSAATLVLSGGTSPIATFGYLKQADVDWARIHITLSDERWVAAGHEDSNERLLKEHLTGDDPVGRAAFLPLYREGESPESRAEQLERELRGMPFPFACSLLGMGEDGHFASLFPDAATLDEGTDVDGRRLAVPVDTAASTHRRLSLTLAALSRSDEIVLLLFGEKKLEVLLEAASNQSAYPVSRLLLQKRAPVRILWSP